MRKFEVEFYRTATRHITKEIEADNKTQARELAEEMSGSLDFVAEGKEEDDPTYDYDVIRELSPLEGVNSSQLDSLVAETASYLASQANNNGTHGQLEFLKIIGGMSEEDILSRIECPF